MYLLFVLYYTGHPGMVPMGPRMGHPGSRMPGDFQTIPDKILLTQSLILGQIARA
jgi:hypothetical protein